MGDFSRSPQDNLDSARKAGYVGLHIEQGVPLLDRDLNLLQDLIVRVTRDVIARYIGSGIAAQDDGFQIRPGATDNDLVIGAGPGDRAGSCLVDGLEVRIPAPINFADQGARKKLITPGPDQPDPRFDLVYLDVWLDSRNERDDEGLGNRDDIGIQTSVRLVPAWAVKVVENAEKLPDPAPGHSHHPLAKLARKRNNARITQAMITDVRQRNLTVTDLERRLRDLERLRMLPAVAGPEFFRPPFGAPGTRVEIFGRNLDLPPISVAFGGRAAPEVKMVSPEKIEATFPDGVPPGTMVEVAVTNAAGTTVSSRLFNARGPQPVITGFSPTKGRPARGTAPATEVTITGDHFDENVDEETTVVFGADEAKITSRTNTKIVTSVPIMNNGPHKISVGTQWGTVESTGDFTVFEGIPS